MAYVLLVDDDDAIRETLSMILQDHGYEVRTAEHGVDALEVIGSHGEPCFALVDLMMPVMDGVELIEKLKSDPRLATIPVVAFSGGSSVAPPAGTKLLRKPLGSDVILREIQQHCG